MAEFKLTKDMISPSWASYGLSIESISGKIDCYNGAALCQQEAVILIK